MESSNQKDAEEGTLTYFVRVYHKRLNIVLAVFCITISVIVFMVLSA